MAAKQMPDIEVLNKFLECDPASGTLRWRARDQSMFPTVQTMIMWNRRYAGKPAFRTRSKAGYYYGQIGGARYLAHRIVWKMACSAEPATLDHINGDTTDNRITNLREVSAHLNMRNRRLSANNTSGAHGVDAWNGRWRARLNLGGRTHHIGMFDNFDDAVAERRKIAVKLGFTDRHG